MNKINIFSKEGLQKNSLSQITGGEEGNETNTSDCTWIHVPSSNGGYSRSDTEKDGDFISSC